VPPAPFIVSAPAPLRVTSSVRVPEVLVAVSDAGEKVFPAETLSDLLKDLRFFKGLKGRSLRQLIVSGARRHLSAGDILVHQGEMGQSFNCEINTISGILGENNFI
jgi:hypothetical protein